MHELARREDAPEQGAFASALNRRTAKATGLAASESFHVTRSEHGLLLVKVLRDRIPLQLSKDWDRLEATHREISGPWGVKQTPSQTWRGT